MEVDKVGLPELLSMDRRPAELALLNLTTPLVEGTEFFVVGVEENEQLLEKVLDILVNPGSVLELDNNVESVDHGQVLKANSAIFQVIEKHTDDSNNLLFVEVVEDLANELNDHKSEVLEALESKMMV